MLPVIRHGSQAEIIESNLKRSFLWSQVQLFYLMINMRVHAAQNSAEGHADKTFEKYLLSIGNGEEDVFPDIGISKIKLPKNLCINPNDKGIDNLINTVYPDIKSNTFTEQMYKRAILSCKNESVDSINNKVMSLLLSQESRCYQSADANADTSQTSLYPVEFLNTLTPSGLPPHSLYLKRMPL